MAGLELLLLLLRVVAVQSGVGSGPIGGRRELADSHESESGGASSSELGLEAEARDASGLGLVPVFRQNKHTHTQRWW